MSHWLLVTYFKPLISGYGRKMKPWITEIPLDMLFISEKQQISKSHLLSQGLDIKLNLLDVYTKLGHGIYDEFILDK